MADLNRIRPYVSALQSAGLDHGPPLSYVELFAGEAAISKGMQLHGYTGRGRNQTYPFV
jgi:hypothetical protein